MFCPNCGANLPEDARHCGNCGVKMADYFSDNPQPQEDSFANPPKKQIDLFKKLSSIFTKTFFINLGLCLVLAGIYTAISLLAFHIINLEETITITTIFSDRITKNISLTQLINLLGNGNTIFHPTITSTSLSVGINILLYATPILAGIAFISTCISRRTMLLQILSSVISTLFAALTALITPLSFLLVPQLKQALSSDLGIIADDFNTFSFTPMIIYAAIIFALVIISIVITAILNKRRAK